MTQEEALLKAIEACTSAAELARRLGVTDQAINQWKVAPAARVIDIETATGKKVTRFQLRPDIFGTHEGASAPVRAKAS